jgi:hypothetical protein
METIKGTPDDTLLLEEQFEREQSNLKYNTFIENSAHDPTNMRVVRDCAGCGRGYMTMIRIGEHSKIMYTCLCGRRESPTDTTGGFDATPNGLRDATPHEPSDKLPLDDIFDI